MIPLPPWLLIGGGALALIAAGVSGWTVRDWKADSDALEAVEAANKARDDAVAQANAASATFEGQRDTIEVQAGTSRTTIERIYRDVPIPADCAVPDAGVGVLDAAISTANSSAGEPVAPLP